MRICIVGAGAIGGLLGVRLSRAGHEVTLIARGPHLAAIQSRGLALELHDGTRLVADSIRATADLRAAGAHDLVILGVKANQVEAIVDDLGALMHPDTIVVPMQNGIPWWYFQRHGGPHEGTVVRAVDPAGRIAAGIDPARILGCVVYPAGEIAAPGVIRHVEGDRFPIGELDGSDTARARRVSETFAAAGFKAPVLPDIRAEIWLKLWGNLTFNPISALTHATLVDICQLPLTRDLARHMMLEAQTVAERLGITFRVDIERRIAGAEKVGRHKTSMLQDVESGRDPEIDALVGSVIELGRLVEVPTPHIAALYALVKLLAQTIRQEKVVVRRAPLAA
jgi:2-dehydropantoate 2-reductase